MLTLRSLYVERGRCAAANMGQKAYAVVIGEGFSNGMALLQKTRWLKL